jgi:farnesyl-diphosphate farnesyltransferase
VRLKNLQDLQDYCYAVAGIVGELLTELFLLAGPKLGSIAAPLRARAARFGEGLQLVNILGDVSKGAAAGRVYLPPNLPIAHVFELAERDLAVALEYNALSRAGGVARGVWAFNTLNAQLARASLRLLQVEGIGSKLTRAEVNRLWVQGSGYARQRRILDTPQELLARS